MADAGDDLHTSMLKFMGGDQVCGVGLCRCQVNLRIEEGEAKMGEESIVQILGWGGIDVVAIVPRNGCGGVACGGGWVSDAVVGGPSLLSLADGIKRLLLTRGGIIESNKFMARSGSSCVGVDNGV
jgi:hypothetical protein